MDKEVTATVWREPDDAAMLKLHERMNAALLEFERAMGIEKANGAIVVPFVAEIHNLLEEAATLGRGTCELINAADDLGEGTSSCMCFECGYTALDDWWKDFNFCPNCGAKVVDE